MDVYGKLRRSVSPLFLVFGLVACADLDPNLVADVLSAAMGTDAGGVLDERTVVAGLKEALQLGTRRTVASTSAEGGFARNRVIHIETPEQLQPMARALRAVGYGRKVDELEGAMNRAAELAAGEATDVFWNAIAQMSFADAYGILNGEQTAATDYFRDRTSAQLTDRFRPIVDAKMKEVGLYNAYQSLSNAYAALPMKSRPVLDLQRYVTDKSISGLFFVLAQEEVRIREDPSARTTELLRKVFAR